MKAYKLNNEEGTIVILNEESFEKVNLCDCYADFGNKVGCVHAGCYTHENTESNWNKDCLSEAKKFLSDSKRTALETFMDDNNIDAYDLISDILNIEDKFYDLTNVLDGNSLDNFTAKIKGWFENNQTHAEVTACNYWNGHKYKTLVLESEFNEPDIWELSDEENEKIMSEYETVSFDTWEFATRQGETENYIFTESRAQGNIYLATVEYK